MSADVETVREVLGDVCGACVASDLRVSSALAALDRLAAAEVTLESERERFMAENAAWMRAESKQRERADAAEAQREKLASDLRHFGRHLPPCPRWITSGDLPDGSPQQCFCGFAAALAAVAPAEEPAT